MSLMALASVSTPNLSVYNGTTMPLAAEKNGKRRPAAVQPALSNGGAMETAFKANHIENKPPPFHNLPQTDPVDLQFKDISYTVKVGFRRDRKEILHRVNGKFPGGQLIAIMGPSGAGKSTLLDVLSGFKTSNVDGDIFINGRCRVLNHFRKMSCYITQEDRLQNLLTVLENMRIAADFKLGKGISRPEKETIIEKILTDLGLYYHQMTMTKRLSGGQRKRLSIALELINNPTIMFLDEPTTGLDSFSCNQVINLLQTLARQGRTIICTIHQPSAKLFQQFDQVYVLAHGNCLYQGSPNRLVPFLDNISLPCPMYHNPADYVIELACAEYGEDKIDLMVEAMENGECLDWFSNPGLVLKPEKLRELNPFNKQMFGSGSLHANSLGRQLQVLLKRNLIKAKRDMTLTYARLASNVVVALMLGWLFVGAGNEGSRVLDNYNLLFGILVHHMMTNMMLTILTFPTEMSVLVKENFNRWYSLKMYFAATNILDFPLALICCLIFSVLVYAISGQPAEWIRFGMFYTISLLVMLVSQSMGLMIGGWFDVVNGTFIGPALTVPLMMFAGFGITIRDLPLWGYVASFGSYLRYGLDGLVCAIYGLNRAVLDCKAKDYCHYKYPKKLLQEIAMTGEGFWTDVYALCIIILILQFCCFLVLRLKIRSLR